MILFIFFALPVATILLAIVLQKVLKCPILVAITFFAIYLIVSFAFFSSVLAEALIATIIYTIIAFITAVIVRLICELKRRFGDRDRDRECNCRDRDRDRDRDNNNGLALANLLNSNNGSQGCCCNNDDISSNDLLRINCSCGNGESSNLLTVSSDCVGNNNTTGNQSGNVAINANFVPCQNNNGRTGFVRGCYRRVR